MPEKQKHFTPHALAWSDYLNTPEFDQLLTRLMDAGIKERYALNIIRTYFDQGWGASMDLHKVDIFKFLREAGLEYIDILKITQASYMSGYSSGFNLLHQTPDAP